MQVGANTSALVTKVSSSGMWLPVHGEEWDGGVPVCPERSSSPQRDSECGLITFKGSTLPWLVGRYEVCPCIVYLVWSFIQPQVRYHHDGKYNVMHLDGPIDIHG